MSTLFEAFFVRVSGFLAAAAVFSLDGDDFPVTFFFATMVFAVAVFLIVLAVTSLSSVSRSDLVEILREAGQDLRGFGFLFAALTGFVSRFMRQA